MMTTLNLQSRSASKLLILCCWLFRVFIVVILSQQPSVRAAAAATAASLILPPTDKIKMGLLEELMEECEDESLDVDATFHWEDTVQHEYQLASRVFTTLATIDPLSSNNNHRHHLYFPHCKNRQGEVDRLNAVLNQHSEMLGGIHSFVEHWPEVPATRLEWTWPSTVGDLDDNSHQHHYDYYQRESSSDVKQAIADTEAFVNHQLGRLGLCPYTKSMTRAAIGLDHLGVQSGPVVIRHASQILEDEDDNDQGHEVHHEISVHTTPAVVMSALFWKGVTELMERPETEASTLLCVAPKCYDEDFAAFCHVCDDLIETSVQFTSGSIGRVWFHPHYELAAVGESTGGHTLPISVVQGMMKQYLNEHPGADPPTSDEQLALGHDLTRRMPHATINLLRGSQLTKAKDQDIRHKIYAKNILSVLKEKEGGMELSSRSVE